MSYGQLTFSNFLFYVYEFFACTCVCVRVQAYAHASCWQRSVVDFGSPGNGVTDGCELPR